VKENYTDPEVFDGFRFERMREQEGESLKHQIVTLDLEYILFGHGRHAWYADSTACGASFVLTSNQPGPILCSNRTQNYARARSPELRREDARWAGPPRKLGVCNHIYA
jgi:hypothetical protein